MGAIGAVLFWLMIRSVTAVAFEGADGLATLAGEGNPNLVNDALAAAELAQAVARIACLNARSNQARRERGDYAAELTRLEAALQRARRAVDPEL